MFRLRVVKQSKIINEYSRGIFLQLTDKRALAPEKNASESCTLSKNSISLSRYKYTKTIFIVSVVKSWKAHKSILCFSKNLETTRTFIKHSMSKNTSS